MRRTNENLDERVKKLAGNFSILKGWSVFAAPDKKNRFNEVVIKKGKKKFTAHIKPWKGPEKEPADYVLHEILHVILFVYEDKCIFDDEEDVAEIEEQLVMDMCRVLKIRGER